ncbi:RNA-directed DNA polymerase, eukaryota, reverse transcriptase zinc-binding domain protein [Tanacetum coccineum]|uniref:RNA-directed DNA polymerase, eukaryota, reverse transcriptase zinc-binding domain protein n=1 Tax=Tanacetum coccineum TaxID=301880 RepID=A0ABQ5AQ21_9ASTR
MLLKFDFEKAFDRVNWGFLDDILAQMGFGNVWRKWIHGCLDSAYTFILVNGSPTKEFKISRGVGQEDPLSPFLFIIVAEALHVALYEAEINSIFKGITIGRDFIISHLQYADDIIFSAVYGVGVNASEVEHVSNEIKCFAGVFLFISLGISLKSGSSTKFWSDVWIGSQSLMIAFPRLFALEINKVALVKDHISILGDFLWQWRRDPCGGREVEQLRLLLDILRNIELMEGPDE